MKKLLEDVMKRTQAKMENAVNYFKNLISDFEKIQNEVQESIETLDSLESVRIQLIEELEGQVEQYTSLKNEICKKKLDKRVLNYVDLSEDFDRLLNTEEVENKVKVTIKRNTVKRNVDARYKELQKELKELQDKNAKGELTEADITRYYLIPELLKEFDKVRI